jgi:hypothetical protein
MKVFSDYFISLLLHLVSDLNGLIYNQSLSVMLWIWEKNVVKAMVEATNPFCLHPLWRWWHRLYNLRWPRTMGAAGWIPWPRGRWGGVRRRSQWDGLSSARRHICWRLFSWLCSLPLSNSGASRIMCGRKVLYWGALDQAKLLDEDGSHTKQCCIEALVRSLPLLHMP